MDLTQIENKYKIKITDFVNLSGNRKIYEIKTNRENFVLKPQNYPDEEFLFIKNCCNCLATKDCRVSEVIADSVGAFSVETGGNKYFLMKKVKGNVADFSDRKQIILIARALAKLHRSGMEFPEKMLNEKRNKMGDYANYVNIKIGDMERWLEQIKQKNKKSYFDFLYSSHGNTFLNQFLQVYEELLEYYEDITKKYSNRVCICHHDLAHHNILIDGEEVGFVDFEYCIADIFVHDLASVLLRIGKANKFNPSLSIAFLQEYEKTLPLDNLERKLLWDYLCLPQDFWQMGLAYYCEVPEIRDVKKKKSRLGRLDKRLTDYIDSEKDRQLFLKKLKAVIFCDGKKGK